MSAAVCGVVGLKPTVSLVPGGGIVPLSTRQDTAGPIGRCVADTAALLTVLASGDCDYTAIACCSRRSPPLTGR
eukprot:SAG22_NODE_13815_length_394_cov_0.698305_1_plen_73_part_10